MLMDMFIIAHFSVPVYVPVDPLVLYLLVVVFVILFVMRINVILYSYELIEERTQTTRTFQSTDGERVLVGAHHPIHYPNPKYSQHNIINNNKQFSTRISSPYPNNPPSNNIHSFSTYDNSISQYSEPQWLPIDSRLEGWYICATYLYLHASM